MAQLKLSSPEIPEIIKLAEQMFPGVQLAAMTEMLQGITAEGTITLKKKITPTETVTLAVTITEQ